MEIKQLNETLIERANNNSFFSHRGDHAKSYYERNINTILSLPISDEKKEKYCEKLYNLHSKLLNYESQHVSVMVAGGSNYDAKKLDKSEQIFKLNNEISNFIEDLKEQTSKSEPKSEVEKLSDSIKYFYAMKCPSLANTDWKKLVKIDKIAFIELYKSLDTIYGIKKNTVPYKLYMSLDEIEEQKYEIVFEDQNYKLFVEGERAYISFILRPQRQLIVALKSRGWWWNSRKSCWSTYIYKLDKEWASNLSEKYKKYI